MRHDIVLSLGLQCTVFEPSGPTTDKCGRLFRLQEAALPGECHIRRQQTFAIPIFAGLDLCIHTCQAYRHNALRVWLLTLAQFTCHGFDCIAVV